MLKLHYNPNVYMVGFMSELPDGIRDFLQSEGFNDYGSPEASTDAEYLIELAGRTCYMSFKGGRPHTEYMKHILEVKHGSVIEHGVCSFILTGISRSLTHELVRHRAGWSYSQLSQRYVDSSGVAFCVPPAYADSVNEYLSVGDDPEEGALMTDSYEAGRVWYKSCVEALSAYAYLTKHGADCAPKHLEGTERRKWARQAARSVLGNAAESKIYATVNFRALRHFLELRCSRHADIEIRKLAGAIYNVVSRFYTHVFGDYTTVNLGDGTFELTTPNVKV
jgi:thymidylate synthase (FAD)